MFSSSSDTTLSCPRCRHVSVVGNSVQGLRKNFAMLALTHADNFDYTDDEDEDDDDGAAAARSVSGFHASSSSCGPVIEVGAHPEMKLVRRIGEEEGGGGVEMWDAVVAGGGGGGRGYGVDVARGVAELHAAGVICMNIKPSSLLLDANGNALVSDYGLAPILKKPTTRPEFDSSKITPCTDYITHSPHYTAPEAWGPVRKLFWEDASGVSPESDAWSFGCTLVEMCTGSIPWDGLSREEIFHAVVKARKVPPQYERIVGVGIPRELWKMIGECLQFKPSKRPTFNAMLATFLRHLQEIPRSPSASPDNGFTKICGVNVVVEETRATNLGVLQDSPNNLHRVILEGDSEGVRNILAKAAAGSGGSSVRFLLEAQNAEGQSALHLACRRGSVELVEAILEYEEADVDIVDKDGDPPLVFALAAGSPQCVHVLIKKGAKVRSRLGDGSGPSVAHVCSYHGQPDCMHVSLCSRGNYNSPTSCSQILPHVYKVSTYLKYIGTYICYHVNGYSPLAATINRNCW